MEKGGDQQKKEMVAQHHPDEGKFSLLGQRALGYSSGHYDKPLSCFGCGIGWFSFILGFAFPPLWYYATVLYFGNYHLKDPRERPGLAASAIAALVCSVAVLMLPACCALQASLLRLISTGVLQTNFYSSMYFEKKKKKEKALEICTLINVCKSFPSELQP
ncbi:hypothetical protein L1049_020304 [Liquidambar formosana]|uniref:Ribosomal protein L18ae family n=1 Tax=Liquidambar formosana TaxID=63359 RepID=A0AAP0S6Z6_LIQFO